MVGVMGVWLYLLWVRFILSWVVFAGGLGWVCDGPLALLELLRLWLLFRRHLARLHETVLIVRFWAAGWE